MLQNVLYLRAELAIIFVVVLLLSYPLILQDKLWLNYFNMKLLLITISFKSFVAFTNLRLLYFSSSIFEIVLPKIKLCSFYLVYMPKHKNYFFISNEATMVPGCVEQLV